MSGAHLDQIAPLTYYEQGTSRWTTARRWIGTDEHAATYKLSGTATLGADNGHLTTATAASGKSTMVPLPVSGLCTRSSNQWTAGVPNLLLPTLPCFTDNKLNDKTGLVFQTSPVKRSSARASTSSLATSRPTAARRPRRCSTALS